jgi:hypothetical protein
MAKEEKKIKNVRILALGGDRTSPKSHGSGVAHRGGSATPRAKTLTILFYFIFLFFLRPPPMAKTLTIYLFVYLFIFIFGHRGGRTTPRPVRGVAQSPLLFFFFLIFF